MAEITTSAVIATTVTGAGVMLLGVNTGLDCPTLIAGVAGGATALSYAEPNKIWVRVFQVASAAIFAGYCAPVMAAITCSLINKMPLMEQKISCAGVELAVAFVIGYMTHGILLPGIRKLGSTFIGRYTQ